MMARKKDDAQMMEISVSADGDFGETKMTETPESRRVGRYRDPSGKRYVCVLRAHCSWNCVPF